MLGSQPVRGKVNRGQSRRSWRPALARCEGGPAGRLLLGAGGPGSQPRPAHRRSGDHYGPMIGGGKPGRSVGKPTTGASTAMNNGMNVTDKLVSAFIVTVQPPIPPHAPPQPASPQARSGV